MGSEGAKFETQARFWLPLVVLVVFVSLFQTCHDSAMTVPIPLAFKSYQLNIDVSFYRTALCGLVVTSTGVK
jgi:hypothetical protein